MMSRKEALAVLKGTYESWSSDNATRLAAALAFYTVLSIAPLLVVVVAVAGFFLGEDAARGRIAGQAAEFVGPAAGKGIETLLAHARAPEESALGSLLGMLVLFFGASGVFGELQAALNAIWRVEPKPGLGMWGVVRHRFFSFTMVMGVAFMLLVSLVLSTVLAAMGQYFASALPGGAGVWELVNFVASFGVITVLFALIFKVVPDVMVAWGDVWLGALATAFLFTLGKFGLGLYLGRASVASPYGAAGSLVVLVIWVYYAAQILFLGAEFTRVRAEARGHRGVPRRDAVLIDAGGAHPA